MVIRFLLGVRVIFNLAYCPQYNTIEGCFSKVKQSFKAQRLQKMARGLRPTRRGACAS